MLWMLVSSFILNMNRGFSFKTELRLVKTTWMLLGQTWIQLLYVKAYYSILIAEYGSNDCFILISCVPFKELAFLAKELEKEKMHSVNYI